VIILAKAIADRASLACQRISTAPDAASA
jgi:hypothetical protein